MRLDAMMEQLGRDGVLLQFNKMYSAHRARAAAQGHGYMSYNQAKARWKKALIPGLQSGKVVSGLFAEVFR